MLEEYTILREEKEQERRRQRVWFCSFTWTSSFYSLMDFVWPCIHIVVLSYWIRSSKIIFLTIKSPFQDQKKIQGQLIAEQEALYGSKPSPSKPQSVKKAPRMSTGGASNRRLSMQAPKPDPLHSIKATPHSRPTPRKADRIHQNEQLSNYLDDGFSALSSGKSLLQLFSCAFGWQMRRLNIVF